MVLKGLFYGTLCYSIFIKHKGTSSLARQQGSLKLIVLKNKGLAAVFHDSESFFSHIFSIDGIIL